MTKTSVSLLLLINFLLLKSPAQSGIDKSSGTARPGCSSVRVVHCGLLPPELTVNQGLASKNCFWFEK
jgi:hypothetical protein